MTILPSSMSTIMAVALAGLIAPTTLHRVALPNGSSVVYRGAMLSGGKTSFCALATVRAAMALS